MICPFCKFENIEGADECANCGQTLRGLDIPEAGLKYPELPAFLKEPLSRLPQRPLVSVATDDPISLAVHRMQTDGTSAVLVIDRERLVGIITSTDILQKVAGRNDDLTAITCGAVMTPEPQSLQPDDSLALALNKMSAGGFRHVPIVNAGRAVNLIDVNDVFLFITPHLV